MREGCRIRLPHADYARDCDDVELIGQAALAQLQLLDVGRSICKQATGDAGHRTHGGSGAIDHGMAASLCRDVLVGRLVGEAWVRTKRAKRSAPRESAVLRHPVAKAGDRVVAVVEARPQPFPGGDSELEALTVMWRRPPDVSDGVESAADLARCTDRPERFGQRS